MSFTDLCQHLAALRHKLAELGADTLYVCGLATFGCVNATVMCALCKDYDVVVEDAYGARDCGTTLVVDLIDHFNKAWEEAGVRLISATEMRF